MAPVHAGLKRRHFLRVLGAAVVAIAAAPLVTAAPAQGLAFYRGAFAAVPRLVWVTRFDVLVGWKTQGDFHVRVIS